MFLIARYWRYRLISFVIDFVPVLNFRQPYIMRKPIRSIGNGSNRSNALRCLSSPVCSPLR